MICKYSGKVVVNNQEYNVFTPCDTDRSGVLTLRKQKYLLHLLSKGLSEEEAAKIIKVSLDVVKIWLTERDASTNRRNNNPINQGKLPSKLPKAVYVLDVNTGETWRHYSADVAANKLEISNTTIYKAIKLGVTVKKKYKFSNEPFETVSTTTA